MSATGTTQASEIIGDLDVTACNKHGEEYAHCKLSGVIYNESFNFNLFSLSKMLGQGWSLNGDDKCITLISPCKSSTIMFDIVIKTPNGCIFATVLTRSHDITATNVQENKEPKLKQKILNGENSFEELLNTVNYCSLGEITECLFELGGRYRRNM